MRGEIVFMELEIKTINTFKAKSCSSILTKMV